MFKLIFTLKRKAGLTLEEFIRYYDENHLPLGKRLLSAPIYLHRRNYISYDHPFYEFMGDNRATSSVEPPFDVITEIFFETEEDARALIAGLSKDPGRQMLEDEKNFLDTSATRFYVVKVHQSAIPW